MNKKKIPVNKIIPLALALIIVGFLAKNITQITYAVMVEADPDVVITIDDGQITQEGNLFGDELWYPGKEKNGIIRIKNNNTLKGVEISNLGLKTKLLSADENYDPTMVYTSFLNNMLLTIKKGRLAVFDNSIVENKTLAELYYKENSSSNDLSKEVFLLSEGEEFTINKESFVDFRYTLRMDEAAENELENMQATVDLLINVNDIIE
ncbi:hypothetical protein [Vallitalea okinawensis]|uniref:hypothetical protein n=1 Tax=Vallitalea okinawensis TaxID=2078660 RepID=UPI000CFD53FC|nr:hypothetical protein [Vallitalea okinawensis]